MPRPATIALGRRPHDAARIARTPQHVVPAGAVLPAAIVRPAPTLYLADNDTRPTCSFAGLANAISGSAAIAWGDGVPIVDADVVAAFDACPVCGPEGAVLQDVLEWVPVHGLAFGAQTPYVPSDIAAVPLDQPSWYHALSTVPLYIGVTLTVQDVARWQAGQPWDDDGSDTSDPYGGHCIVGWTAAGMGDGDAVKVLTWRTEQPGTVRWLGRRMEECWRGKWGI